MGGWCTISRLDLRYDAVASTLGISPPPRDYRPCVPLSDLPPGRYVDVTVRVTSMRVRDAPDDYGPKRIISGTLEDPTFRVPFVCHKLSLPLHVDAVLRITSAYVHAFSDNGLLLVLTEYTRAYPVPYADRLDYIWNPTIASISRPVVAVTLKGRIRRVVGSSGLVKRCQRCGMVIYDRCHNGCDAGYDWDVRLSADLDDGTGAIRMVLGATTTARLMGWRLSEVILLANAANVPNAYGADVITYTFHTPPITVTEALVDDPLAHRRHDRLVVAATGASRIYAPSGVELGDVLSSTTRRLDPTHPDDAVILQRLVDQAVGSKVRGLTHQPRLHGLYLVTPPVKLYRCEQARLYLGFTLTVECKDGAIVVEAYPEGCVRERVVDYLRWRRDRGASARALRRALLGHRSDVLVAPFGRYGTITDVLFDETAGSSQVSAMDDRNFTAFWRDVYGIRVDPDESPLLRVALMGLNVTLTYPPSCVFYDASSLWMSPGLRRFVENRTLTAYARTRSVLDRVVKDLRLGDVPLRYTGWSERADIRRLIRRDIRRRLLGRAVWGRGRVGVFDDARYFFPYKVQFT